MNHYYILFKITVIPGGEETVAYAKELSWKRVHFTNNREHAKKIRFVHAVFFSAFYGLSTVQCAHTEPTVMVDQAPLHNKREFDKTG